MKPSYEGPGPDYVSVDWCCGQVTGGNRIPEYPNRTSFSVQVRQRIVDGRTPRRTIAEVLQWPTEEVVNASK
jgi:hypothetical protein